VLLAVERPERVLGRIPPEKEVLDEILLPQTEALWSPELRNKPPVQAYFRKADLMLYAGVAYATPAPPGLRQSA
jgi:hypothetical protein